MRGLRKPRWIGALLGGLVLPFDPLLGMVLLVVGLYGRPARPRVVPPEVVES